MASLLELQQAASDLLQEERENSLEHSRIVVAMQEDNLRQVSNLNVELSQAKEVLDPFVGLLRFLSGIFTPFGFPSLLLLGLGCWTRPAAALYLNVVYGKAPSCFWEKDLKLMYSQPWLLSFTTTIVSKAGSLASKTVPRLWDPT